MKIGTKWENIRWEIMAFVSTKIWRVPPGLIPCWPVRTIHAILFPLRALYARQSQIKRNWERDTITIDGQEISMDMIKAISEGRAVIRPVLPAGAIDFRQRKNRPDMDTPYGKIIFSPLADKIWDRSNIPSSPNDYFEIVRRERRRSLLNMYRAAELHALKEDGGHKCALPGCLENAVKLLIGQPQLERSGYGARVHCYLCEDHYQGLQKELDVLARELNSDISINQTEKL